MIIRCYGARGSISVSGSEYLKYGGETTCLEIRSKNDEIIIVDAGSGVRRLGNRLLSEQRFEYHMLFTHSHWDHILGFPFFKPIYHEKTIIHLTGCPATQGNMKKLLFRALAEPFFPFRFDRLKSRIDYSGDCPLNQRIDSIEIFSINLSHPNLGRGLKFVEDGKTFVFLTDNELAYRHRNGLTLDDYAGFARDADLLIHDAEYSEEQYKKTRTWGHSTYSQALELALEAGVKSLGLFHHNQDRTDADLDAIVLECRQVIKDRGVNMECFALTQATELTL